MAVLDEPATTLAPAADEALWAEVTPQAARRLAVAAVQAFAEHGYHATSTRDIAARAGMSPAALYIHYPSKEELLYRIAKIGYQHALGTFVRAASGAETAPQRIAALVRALTLWHAEHHTAALAGHYEIDALAPEHRAEVDDIRRRIERIVQDAIAEGVGDEVFTVPDIRGAALAILSLTIDVARWFQYEHQRSAEQVADLYAVLVLRMLGYWGRERPVRE